MQTMVLHSNSKTNFKLIAEIARKFGLTVKILTDEDKEDIGLIKAITHGRTGKYVNTENFVKKLRK